jgi:hypothetical protein
MHFQIIHGSQLCVLILQWPGDQDFIAQNRSNFCLITVVYCEFLSALLKLMGFLEEYCLVGCEAM